MFNHFLKTISSGIIGAICGALAGFLLAFLIKGLIVLLCLIFNSSNINEVPIELLALLSIGAGTALGGTFGGIIAIKKL